MGSEVGCEAITELTLQAPLVLAERDGVQLQVLVGEPDESGQRTVDIYSRPESAVVDGLSGRAAGLDIVTPPGCSVPRRRSQARLAALAAAGAAAR